MFWICLCSGLVLDQAVKFLIRATMQLGQSIPVIEGVFHLTYVLNEGAAFSILQGQRWFFLLVTLLAVLFIIWFLRGVPKQDKLMRLALGLFCGGALGNFTDRLLYGRVVDFFDFRIFPVFNIADCCIVIGCGLLCIRILRGDKKQLPASGPEPAEEGGGHDGI